MGFIQVAVTDRAMRERALEFIQMANTDERRPALDFISPAFHGKTIGFEKIIKMIDDVVVELKKEQVEDDNKKRYCDEQFDLADDAKFLEDLEKNCDIKQKLHDENVKYRSQELAALDDTFKILN